MSKHQKFETKLSTDGQIRRDRMKHDLQRELVRLQSQKQRRKRMAGLAACLAVVALSGYAVLEQARVTDVPGSNNEELAVNHPENPKKQTPKSFVTVVGNVPGVVDKYVVRTDKKPEPIDRISDQEMLELLSANGTPGFLGVINGKTVVIPVYRSAQ